MKWIVSTQPKHMLIGRFMLYKFQTVLLKPVIYTIYSANFLAAINIYLFQVESGAACALHSKAPKAYESQHSKISFS